jgi:hypothetical protein
MVAFVDDHRAEFGVEPIWMCVPERDGSALAQPAGELFARRRSAGGGAAARGARLSGPASRSVDGDAPQIRLVGRRNSFATAPDAALRQGGAVRNTGSAPWSRAVRELQLSDVP